MTEFDPGPSPDLARDLDHAAEPPVAEDFWRDWGPVFYRGRVDGSAPGVRRLGPRGRPSATEWTCRARARCQGVDHADRVVHPGGPAATTGATGLVARRRGVD